MSNYWSLRCNTCDVTSYDELNHGQQVLRDIMAMAPDLVAIQQKDSRGYIEMNVMGHSGELLEFARQHIGHDVVLLSEYGVMESIEQRNE